MCDVMFRGSREISNARIWSFVVGDFYTYKRDPIYSPALGKARLY